MKYATRHASVLVHGLMSPAANLRAPSASCFLQPLCNYVSLYIIFAQQLASCFSHQMNYSAADSVLNPNNSSSNTSCSWSPFKSVLETLFVEFFHTLQQKMGLEKWGSAQCSDMGSVKKSAKLGDKSSCYYLTQLFFSSGPLFSSVPICQILSYFN